MAGRALQRVKAPTLLIVGADDLPILELNRGALTELKCERRLEIIPEASHLFEEPGALDKVARLARDWFETRLGSKTEGSSCLSGASQRNFLESLASPIHLSVTAGFVMTEVQKFSSICG